MENELSKELRLLSMVYDCGSRRDEQNIMLVTYLSALCTPNANVNAGKCTQNDTEN